MESNNIAIANEIKAMTKGLMKIFFSDSEIQYIKELTALDNDKDFSLIWYGELYVGSILDMITIRNRDNELIFWFRGHDCVPQVHTADEIDHKVLIQIRDKFARFNRSIFK